jgi:hypothetical protein
MRFLGGKWQKKICRRNNGHRIIRLSLLAMFPLYVPTDTTCGIG